MQKKYFKKNEILNNEIIKINKMNIFYKWREAFDEFIDKKLLLANLMKLLKG
jgi:hypothetical protein